MTGARAIRAIRIGARPAFFVGLAAAFVAGVDLARWAGTNLLADREASWSIPRLALWLALVAASAIAGVVAAVVFRRFAATPLAAAPLEPLALSRAALAAVAVAAIAAGIAVRATALATPAIPFLEDEVNLIGPALALSGTPRDFSDAVIAIPLGRPDPHEVVGVAYLELLRASLGRFGATIAGLRMTSFLGGALSLVTGALLARALLPRGGATAAVLVLAGLRWHAILSFSGWHSVLLLPIVDTATLLLLRARRRGVWLPAAAGGAVMGLGPHLYLASWVAASALAAFAVWPWPARVGEAPALRRRLLAFLGGFALVVAPLFLFAEGRRVSYFGRSTRHNVLREMRYQKSALPLFAAAADALPAPWFLPDPEGRHDLAESSRLGWVVGAFAAVGLGRAVASRRSELAGLLLCQGAVAGAAAIAGGTAGHPNGFRFGYLASLAALAAAAGLLACVGAVAASRRRAAALAGLGLLAASGVVGLRQAAVEWPAHRATFDSFRGEDTLIGRAAARWEPYGPIAVAAGLGRSDLTIDTVRRYRLDSADERAVSRAPAAPTDPTRAFSIRITAPGTPPGAGERLVERVRDGWGRDWAVVLAAGSAR